MIKEKWKEIRQEFAQLSTKERIFILCAALCGFFISCDYAIVRPVSNSVFISSYSASFFPYAWLATVPLNLCLVALYNQYLPRLGTYRTFLVFAGSVISLNIFSSFFLTKISWLPFLFYTWKEVYIMLMFQQLWSTIHSTIAFNRAKYLYGILFGVGALGAVFGSTIPGFFAVKMGSEKLLLASIPVYLLLSASFLILVRNSSTEAHTKIEEEKRSAMSAFKHGMQMIGNSKLLIFILLIVTFMQVSSSLIDYQFNHYLEHTIATKDLRTQYTARVMGIVHLTTVALQFFGSFLLVHFLGIRRSHFAVPFLLCINSIAFLFFPAFAMISLSYITIKCFDFSLFGVIKEMLYIPLKKDEKFRAKSIIDVFAYRSAKAVASFLILGLQLIVGIEMQSVLTWMGICLFGLWCLVVRQMLRNYQPQAAV